jgi:PAS domain S-box-containing protein
LPFFKIELRLLRNGVSENVFIKLVYEALFDEDGSISGVIAVADEITEQVVIRKKIEESEARFRLATNLMPAKITNANPAGGVTYCNKEWLDFTGVDFEDFKNFGYHNVMHPDELVEFQNRFQKAFKTGTDLEMEMRFMDLDGEYKWHLNRASPVKNENGDIEMWIGVTTEIQKLKEEEKRKGEF